MTRRKANPTTAQAYQAVQRLFVSMKRFPKRRAVERVQTSAIALRAVNNAGYDTVAPKPVRPSDVDGTCRVKASNRERDVKRPRTRSDDESVAAVGETVPYEARRSSEDAEIHRVSSVIAAAVWDQVAEAGKR